MIVAYKRSYIKFVNFVSDPPFQLFFLHSIILSIFIGLFLQFHKDIILAFHDIFLFPYV
jgi:hypothetical protein